MTKINYLFCIFLIYSLIFFSSCGNDNPGQPELPPITNSGIWSIPENRVVNVIPADNIPSLTNPIKDFVDQINYLEDEDLVIGFKVGDDVRAYPHPILDWHEIINEDVGNINIAITYCPLTGTAVGWDRNINGNVTTFGVSGRLYNTNLMPYDRSTASIWSQMLLKGVNGNFIDEEIETHMLVETTWATWRNMYPNSKVVTTNTGFSRSYTFYPYGDYRTNDDNLLFDIDVDDNRLARKERVLGVLVGDIAKAYRFEDISPAGAGISTLIDQFNGQRMVIVGSTDENFLLAYQTTLSDGTGPTTFTPIQGELPIIMEDEEGNKYDIFGEVLEGPREGERLEETISYIGFWFAWGTFYPDLEIYQ